MPSAPCRSDEMAKRPRNRGWQSQAAGMSRYDREYGSAL